MSPLTASTDENDATEVVIKSFDLFLERVDRAFKSMVASSSSSKSFWRTSEVLAIRLPGKNITADDDDDDKEEEEEEEDQERENKINDCLFGTKKETRKSIGKCDRLDRETEFDRDDMMAVGTTEDFMVVRKKRKRYVIPDHERFPEKYVKYSFDEPVVVGGGESGREKKKRKKEKTDDDDDEVREGVPPDALARSADVEKTTRDVGEPRIMRGKKKKEGADAEKQSRKRTKRVTRSLSIATTSIAAQDVEENGG